MDYNEVLEDLRLGGIVNYFQGAKINKLVINGYGKRKKVASQEDTSESTSSAMPKASEELFKYIHPQVTDEKEEWAIHNEVKRLVTTQDIRTICSYLMLMRDDKKILLPASPSAAYNELVRMGMPCNEGFNEKTFCKYYMVKQQ